MRKSPAMSIQNLSERYERAKADLEAVGQSHVLGWFDQLDLGSQTKLLSQIESIDWPEVGQLVKTHVLEKPDFELGGDIQPAPWYPNDPGEELKAKYAEAWQLGRTLVGGGKVAGFTVAGGQGTRLGWPGPKGTFPATPIRKLPLFACFAEYIQNVQRRYDTVVPWYVMTSPINDAATRAFFEESDYFGLDPRHVMLFPQQMMPAIDMKTGKVLLEQKDSIAMSPNGHGGSLKALYTSGAITDMLKRGVEQISYTQVDNPMVRVIDPLFIGLHAMDDAEMSSKMLPKRDPFEKLGNFCIIDGKMTVIEYSDLPDDLAVQRDENGQLRFLAGSIAIHAIRVDFVQRLGSEPGGFALPKHRAEKKVPYLDFDSGQIISPDEANAVKLEMFVFDALPLAERTVILETSRVEEFSPVKNATGADSLSTSLHDQVRRAAEWLEDAGIEVPRDANGVVACAIEISPLYALNAQQLAQRVPGDLALEAGGQLYLGG